MRAKKWWKTSRSKSIEIVKYVECAKSERLSLIRRGSACGSQPAQLFLTKQLGV